MNDDELSMMSPELPQNSQNSFAEKAMRSFASSFTSLAVADLLSCLLNTHPQQGNHMHPNAFLQTYWRMDLRPQVFVAMSFADEYKARFDNVIAPAVRSIQVNGVSLAWIPTGGN